MTNEVSNTGGGLPANVASMAGALAQSASQAGAAGGSDLYCKFTKFGEWVYGAENTETEEGSIWAINPTGFQHGYTAWGREDTPQEGKNVGEVVVPATQPMPLESELPEVAGDWSKCIAVQMRCTNGEDEGVQVLFKANSLGGRKAYAALLQAVIGRIGEGNADCVPLVELNASHYDHKKYGKIFTPVIEIVGWANMEGEQAAEPETTAAVEDQVEEVTEQAEEPAEEKAPPRRRRRKAS